MIKEKSGAINNAIVFLKGREMVYNGFESGTFPLLNQPIVLAKREKSSSSEKRSTSEKLSSSEKSSPSEYSSDYYEYISPETGVSGRGLKLLTPRQMLQRLSITLV